MSDTRATYETATGGCLCGAVRFVARNVPKTFGVCHCPMCRRWTGSALFEVSVKTEDITWEGADHIAVRASSDYAERAWCRECGSGIWFRQTKEDKWFGSTDLPLGIFDDPSAFDISHEIFVDQAAKGVCLKDDGQKRLTRADVVALNPNVERAS